MPFVLVEKINISDVRQQLRALNLLRENERIRKLASGLFAIPVLPSAQPSDACCSSFIVDGRTYKFKQNIDDPPLLTKKPYDLMREAIEVHLKEAELWRDGLRSEIPRSWVKYGDLILFGRNYFEDPVWKVAGEKLWEVICKSLKVKRLGRMYAIKPDGFRTPRVEIMYGDDSWISVVDGHVRYTWDVRFCMFSPGNATERFRVAQMNCLNETVVDMYAGIGYFTIPFLLHAKAGCVHACEWNPHALAALRQNLHNNKVTSRCHIHAGDNREVCPQNIADRVYLGLIPTCQPGIETACKALKFHTGGVLHLHENVCSWKDPSKNGILSFSSNSLLVMNSDSSSKSYAKTALTNNEKLVELKSNSAEELQGCQRCREYVAKFSSYLLGDVKNNFISCDGRQKFNYSGSFTIEGSDGIICECSSIKVIWKRREWFCHAVHLTHTVCSILSSFHNNSWVVSVIGMHHVKSYAPHIDHIVYDLKCSPVTKAMDH